MESRNIAIIGASYLQLPLIEKAKEMGFITHVFAWAANDIGETAADYFYPISITEVDEITEKCREIGICGICSIATDLGNYTVNFVANKLGLPGNSMECTRMSTNKHLMREAFERCGDPSPKSILVDATSDLSALDLDYPVIVKPTDRSGSRGIFKLETPEGLEDAVKAATYFAKEIKKRTGKSLPVFEKAPAFPKIIFKTDENIENKDFFNIFQKKRNFFYFKVSLLIFYLPFNISIALFNCESTTSSPSGTSKLI